MMRIIPAILAYSQEEFVTKLETVSGFSDTVQIDIVDRSFSGAPTITVADIRKIPGDTKPIFHLMIEYPEDAIDQCLTLGAERIIFHHESSPKWQTITKALPQEKIGVAINPETKLDEIRRLNDKVMEVLLMTVTPGASGREFQWNVIKKVEKAKGLFDNRAVISMDGGIDEEKIPYLLKQKLDIAYIASTILEAPNPEAEFYHLRGIIEEDERS